MLEQAMRDWPIELTRSFLIGDRDGDMEAAAAFKIPGIRFDWKAESLLNVVRAQVAKLPTR
jgi:D-glycero-D-manno-heptose 1,7-bisphosphate phosphatase